MNRIRVNHRSRKPKKESKTIPLWGSPERGEGLDHGKYFRCWNCGFICDSERDSLGDAQSKSNIAYENYDLLDEYGASVSDTGGTKHTIFEGEGYTTTRKIPVVSTGCPLCGTLNWRGDY